MNISEYLISSLSPDQHIRQTATAALEKASLENYASYLQLLCHELSNERQVSHIRVAAGVAVKNSLTAKESHKRLQLAERWVNVDINIKASIKSLVLQTLNTNDVSVGTTAAQVISTINQIDLPRNEWPELTSILLQNVTSPSSSSSLKKATLETLGFICEEIDARTLSTRSNEILTAIIQGARKEEPNAQVRKAAMNALCYSLSFIRSHFEVESERNFIMIVVFEGLQDKDDKVAVASFECMINILGLYYHYMLPYMTQGLFTMTIECMKHPNEKIALQAIEFWSTVCDEEIDRQIDLAESREVTLFHFAKSALPSILPTLLNMLACRDHDDDGDEDEWNVSKAAGTCLSLLANCVQDDIVGPKNTMVISYVEQNITSNEWRRREAAIMAFASILDGPRPELVAPYVIQALPLITKMLRDTSIAVKDTAAWAIGRICEILYEVIPVSDIPELFHVLLEGLKEPPRVASHCACSIFNLAGHLGSESIETETSILSPLYGAICSGLFAAAQRADADDSNLKAAVYQALSNVILYSAQDTFPITIQILETLLSQLTHTLALMSQRVNFDDEMKIFDIQSHICNLLQSIIKKLGGDRVLQYVERMMSVFLQILSNSSISKAASIYEDILLTIGTLITEIEEKFKPYLEVFFPKLADCLSNHAQYILCSIAVGIVGDLARALNKNMLPLADPLMRLLLEAIQDPALDRSVKPPIISAFGDIAMALGSDYTKYLSSVMALFEQACRLQVDKENPDDIDYLNELRESILEAFTCIVQGMKSDHRADIIYPFVEIMFDFIMRVSFDEDITETEARNAIGLLGDLVDAFGSKLKTKIEEPWVKPFIKEYKRPERHTESTINIASWTLKIISQV